MNWRPLQRKNDRIMTHWGWNNHRSLLWLYKGYPIAVTISHETIGGILRLDSRGMKLSKALVNRLNILLNRVAHSSEHGYRLVRAEGRAVRWRLVNTASGQERPWKGQLILTISPPPRLPPKPDSICDRLHHIASEYYGKDR
jgi:hypothetical protein